MCKTSRTFIVALIVTLISSLDGLAQVKNGSFEETAEIADTDPLPKSLKEQNWEFDEPLILPKDWTPNASGKDGEYRLISDKTQAHTGNICVFVKGDFYGGGSVSVEYGDKVTITFWAKAETGKRPIGGYLYAYGKNKEGQVVFLNSLGFGAVAEDPEWKKFTGTLAIPVQMQGCLVQCALRGSGAYFDDVELECKKAGEDLVGRGEASGGEERSGGTGKADGGGADPLNGGFENWGELNTAPDGWNLTGRKFPQNWRVEGRPGGSGFLRQVCNQTNNEFGNCSVFLTGKIISRHMLQNLRDKTLNISFWARGKNGRVVCRLRESGDLNGEILGAIVDVVAANTTDAWQEYAAPVTMIGSASLAWVELDGQGVFIDRLKAQVFEPPTEVKTESPKSIWTIPITSRRPTIDGQFAPGEWSDAVGMQTGFMNISTQSAVWRQTECYLTSDGVKLFVGTRYTGRVDEAKGVIKKRDGEVWADESVELYVNPYFGEPSPPCVYQFVVNSLGTIFDQRQLLSIGQNEVGWDCRGMEVGTGRQDGCWILEMAVPMAEIEIKAGKPFGLNLARNLRAPSEFCSLTGMGYQDYQNMLLCRLVEGAPSLRWGYQGAPKKGRLNLAAQVGNPTAEQQTYRAALTLESTKRKEVNKTLRLGPRESQPVDLRAEDLFTQSGNLSFKLADANGNAVFSHSVRISVDDFVMGEERGVHKHQVEFYPIQKKVNIRLLDLAARRTAKSGLGYGRTDVFLLKDDRLVSQHVVEKPWVVENVAHITVPFDPQEDGAYVVKAVLHDEKGGFREFISESIEKQATPWLGNNLGKDRVVIPPFSPMETKGDSISYWGRKCELNGTGLPSSILSQGEEVLAKPVGVVVEDAKGARVEPANIKRLQFKDQSKDRVGFEGGCSFGRLRVNLTGWMEYDGVARYEMELVPEGEVDIGRLALEIPVRNVRYLHWSGGFRRSSAFLMDQPPAGEGLDSKVPVWSPAHCDDSGVFARTFFFPRGDGLIWSSLGVKTSGVYGNFLPFLWLGNGKYGISWFADSDRGWINGEDSPCFELTRQGTATTLKVNIITKAKLKAARKVVFGMVATPVRPRLTGGTLALGIGILGFGNLPTKECLGITFPDYYLAKKAREQRLRGRAGLNQPGGFTHAYMANLDMPLADPAMKYMLYEWMCEPLSVDNSALSARKYNVYGPEADHYLATRCCPCPSRTDYIVHCMNRAMDEGAIDGVYMDNSYPNVFTGVQQISSGYVREDGHVQGSFHLFETRELIKRCTTLSYLHKTLTPYFSVHSTSAMVIPCFTFADLCIDGEWEYSGNDFMDVFSLPYLEVIGAGAWGPNQGWLPMQRSSGAALEQGTRTLLGALKLYDMWIWPTATDVGCLTRVEKIEKEFGIAEKDTRFVGYWMEEAKAIGGLPAGLKASFYSRPGKGGLIYLTNFKRDKQRADLRFDIKEWTGAKTKVLDAETGQVVNSANGVFAVEVGGRNFRLIRVQGGHPEG